MELQPLYRGDWWQTYLSETSCPFWLVLLKLRMNVQYRSSGLWKWADWWSFITSVSACLPLASVPFEVEDGSGLPLRGFNGLVGTNFFPPQALLHVHRFDLRLPERVPVAPSPLTFSPHWARLFSFSDSEGPNKREAKSNSPVFSIATVNHDTLKRKKNYSINEPLRCPTSPRV